MSRYIKDLPNTYRDYAIKAACQLMYGNDVLRKLRAAETEGEIARIMITARKKEESLNGKNPANGKKSRRSSF